MSRSLRFPKWATQSERRTNKPQQNTFGLSPYHRRLIVESLEDRRLLSVFTVNNVDDGTVTKAGDLPGSLRQALFDANANPGSDTVVFDNSLNGEAIELTSGVLEISDPLTIQGLGASQLTVDAKNNNRAGLFQVDQTASGSAISGLTISGGSVMMFSAAIYDTGTLTVSNCTLSGNDGAAGEGVNGHTIYFDGSYGGTLTVTGCNFTGNICALSGAIGYSGSSSGSDSLSVGNCTFSGNTGACVDVSLGRTVIYGCAMSNNTFIQAISSSGVVTVTASTISGNTSGGIWNNGGTMTVINSTVFGNGTDANTLYGGGIWNAGTLTVQDSTITGNSAVSTGGGIDAQSGSVTLQNSIVAKNYNASSPDISGTVAAASSYNLIGNGSGSSGLTNGSNGNQVGTAASPLNPELGSLANNGGPTMPDGTTMLTVALLPGSPAIDHGSNALAVDANGNPLTTDQRGLPRIVNITVDIGACEYQTVAPTVTGINPMLGPATGGTLVTITGTGFTGATAVDFGSTPGTSLTVVSDTVITVKSPPGSDVVDVTVVTPGGTSAKSSADQFSYTPVVTGINPVLGPATGGTLVTITGTGFTGATAVDFGSTPGTSLTVVSDTDITVKSPPGSDVVDVTVVTPGGTSAKSSADQFSYTPVVTGINPVLGPATGGTLVTITGTGFTGATAVDFGSTPGTSLTVVSDTVITVKSPPGSDVVDVTVVTPGGTSAKSSADQFSYTPVVTGINPVLGSATGGTLVTIMGWGFTGATAVDFGSTPGTSLTVVSDTDITVKSPPGSDVVDVTVVTPGGKSATSAADHFTYVAAPTVTSISPLAGPLDGGTKVTITGTNLAGATAVDFGTTAVTTFTSDTANQIVLNSPAGSAGTVDVRVVTAGGTSPVNPPADQFSYVFDSIGLYDPSTTRFLSEKQQ